MAPLSFTFLALLVAAIAVVVVAAVPSKQPAFSWEKTKYVYAFGDSYTFVQGTEGHANFRWARIQPGIQQDPTSLLQLHRRRVSLFVHAPAASPERTNLDTDSLTRQRRRLTTKYI